MIYLCTGAAGFICNKVCEFLLEAGHTVVGVDNMNDYYDVRLKEYRLKNLELYENFYFYEIDIENYSDVEELFVDYKFDAVINLAARAGVRYSLEDPFVYMTTNANATLNLLELMRHNGVKKFVLASTSSLYAGQKMPFLEDLAVNTPISPYAASKKAAEVMCYSYHSLYNLDISVVRYFTVFGPSGRPDMSVYRFIKWIDEGSPIELFGDGSQSRDFTYVDDIAKGTIAALKNVGYEIVNLGGGNNPVSMNYIIQNIERLLGKKAVIDYKPFHKADIISTWADISKAKKLLDWKPSVSTLDGLEKTVEWYLDNKGFVSILKLPE
ncbi:MAG: GDP-mannose 4,6-dehydratase [Candidatus Muirbacterium halophilum]|nr:GDP-mannose 4,6-dehydratase [Candidatus Muirbacterium halophilum]MCK9476406.1 GDP-mannose 4,6-dehydratase [Candidatus Muirbacterium halophilum]